MKIKPIYYEDYTNFLHIPETDEEARAFYELAMKAITENDYFEMLQEELLKAWKDTK